MQTRMQTPTPTPTPTLTPTPTPTTGPSPGVTLQITRPPLLIVTRPVVIPLFPLIKKNVAFIYRSDANGAADYETAIEASLGTVAVTTISLSKVGTTDFTNYSAIIVGPDTGSGSSWGDSTAVNKVKNAGKPILGMGDGGYAFFGKMGLFIGYPNAAHGSESGYYVVSPSATIYKEPNAITVPGDRRLQLYTVARDSVRLLDKNRPGNVALVGLEIGNSQYAMVAVQMNEYILWGFNHGAKELTKTGSGLLGNLVSYLVSQ